MKKTASIIFITLLIVSFSAMAQDKKETTTIKSKTNTTKEDGKVTENQNVTEAKMDNKHVKFVKEKGELKELTVDGKKIEKENFKDYLELIAKIEKMNKKTEHKHDPNHPHSH